MSARVRVKICGITNRDDAEMAIALGADALGFNGYAGSRRFISLSENGEWLAALPPFVSRVAVLVNPAIQEAVEVFAMPFIDSVQFHGEEDAAFLAPFAARGLSFYRAIRLRDSESVAQARELTANIVLLDTPVAGAFGGTGRLIDLDLAAEFARARPDLKLVLAGGLTPENVGDAVARVRPFAVDVASGVESAPGKKDRALVRAFIEAARSA